MSRIETLISLISVILLLITRQSFRNITVQQFLVLQGHQRRRFQLSCLQDLSAFYLNLRARCELARRPRSTWVFPRPQNRFQQLLNNNILFIIIISTSTKQCSPSSVWWQGTQMRKNVFQYVQPNLKLKIQI